MINTDEKSNTQSWELEVTCKNKEYLNQIVSIILSVGIIEFEVNTVDGYFNEDDVWEGRYLVLLWCSGFTNLNHVSKEFAQIEDSLK